MGIVGLTDQYKTNLDTNPRGKPVRLGYLQKGYREGFAKKIKLHDLDHFRFKPVASSQQQEARMLALFEQAYGKEPRAIDDVRIPVALAGNFRIEECASMIAMKHTEQGSIFMAEGDGAVVRRSRNPETGKVERHDPPLAWEDATELDRDGKPWFIYGDKRYAWAGSMAIDLILPAFNDLLYKERLAGAGVVTFITHSNNDIPTLIGEYYQMLDEMAGLFANPMDPHSAGMVRNYIPLRDTPLRLYRSNDTVSTPDWRSKDGGNRLVATRWLCHWSLNPDFAAAIHKAREGRTQKLLAYIADAPMLAAGGAANVAQINDDLYGTSALDNLAALPARASQAAEDAAPEYDAPDWEQLAEDAAVVDGEYEEGPPFEEEAADDAPWDSRPANEEPEVARDGAFWQQSARDARTLDALAAALFQLHAPAGVIADAPEAKRGIEFMAGKYPRAAAEKRLFNEAALVAMATYVNGVADGAGRKESAAAGQQQFATVLAALQEAEAAVGEEE